MKISITGANGFVGRALLDELLRQGHDLTMLSRQAEREAPAGVKLLRGSLVAADCPLDQFVDGCEVIYHCAGEIRDESRMRSLHVDATQRLLDAALNEASKTGQAIHWVQLSSVGVYGPPRDGPASDRSVTETTKTNPVGEYETTKTIADGLLLKACQPGLLTCSIVRPSNIFGKHMPNQSLRSLGEIIRKRLFFYIGKPGAIATYVHVDDVVAVLLRCASDNQARGEVFNVSNDCLLEELVSGIAQNLGVPPPTLRLPETLIRPAVSLAMKFSSLPLSPERIDALVARTKYPATKLESRLGYEFKAAVSDSIGEVFDD